MSYSYHLNSFHALVHAITTSYFKFNLFQFSAQNLWFSFALCVLLGIPNGLLNSYQTFTSQLYVLGDSSSSPKATTLAQVPFTKMFLKTDPELTYFEHVESLELVHPFKLKNHFNQKSQGYMIYKLSFCNWNLTQSLFKYFI